MSPNGTAWFAALKRHIASTRKHHPLPEINNLSAEDFSRCRLQGGTLIAWLDRYAPRLLQERAMFSHLRETETEPFIIVLSDVSGLVAAEEILGASDGVASLASSEFRVFSRAHPDENYKWHVRFINEIGPAKGEIAARAVKEYPLKHGEEHWIHDEASIMGPLFGRGAQHFVKWDGTNVTILQEAFGQWIS